MSTTAFRAAFIASRTVLVGDGTWGERVYRDLAPAGATLPFVIMAPAGGGTLYEHKGRGKNARIRYICLGNTQSEADAGAAQISSLLEAKGTQETETGALDASASGWEITLARAGDDFQPPMENDESREIYRAGVDIDFKCERTS